MSLIRKRAVFGTRRRTEVLILIALLGETYPSELARQLGAPLFSIQTVVEALERDGIVATRKRGGTRLVTLDPRFYAAKELRKLLLRLAEGEPEIQEASTRRRTRPRRRGKPL
jgi:DNA-binding transcriptional ArsR family regulator